MGEKFWANEPVEPRRMSKEETFELEKSKGLEKIDENIRNASDEFENNPNRLKNALLAKKRVEKLEL